jgi:predicted nucleotidyltransferase
MRSSTESPGFSRGEEVNTTKGLARARERYALDLREAVKRATALLSEIPEVRRVSLFGSYARGRQDLCTDLDLLVIMEPEAGVVERLQRLYSLLALPVDYDVVCYTSGEWENIQHQPFWRHARKTEVVLYERR